MRRIWQTADWRFVLEIDFISGPLKIFSSQERLTIKLSKKVGFSTQAKRYFIHATLAHLAPQTRIISLLDPVTTTLDITC